MLWLLCSSGTDNRTIGAVDAAGVDGGNHPGKTKEIKLVRTVVGGVTAYEAQGMRDRERP
jgi:hypothetical protein